MPGLATRHPGATQDSLLWSLCWCATSYVLVTPEDVRNGRTGVCGRRDCLRPSEPGEQTCPTFASEVSPRVASTTGGTAGTTRRIRHG